MKEPQNNAQIINLDQARRLKAIKKKLTHYSHYMNELTCHALVTECEKMIKKIKTQGVSQKTIFQSKAIVQELTERILYRDLLVCESLKSLQYQHGNRLP